MHGTIDLAYELGGRWHVIDFKTDEIGGRTLAEVAAPYLPQLALYAGALKHGTGSQPTVGLPLLRTGDVFEPPVAALERALAVTRTRVDAGAQLDEEEAREGVQASD